MGFWSSLAALFVRDTVKAYSDAKKEVNAEIKKNHGFLHEWEYLDDECYKKYSPLCISATNVLMRNIDEILSLADYSVEKINLIKKTVSAYPYYIVLIEQGGGVNEVQERFLKNLRKTDTCYSGEDIKSAAKNSNYGVAIEIEEACGLTDGRFGNVWKDLISISCEDKDKLVEKVGLAVETMTMVIVNFALMADVIVEQELKDNIMSNFTASIDLMK